MADDDQQQRYWFPYWSSPAAPARAPRPVLRPQLSRRDTRPAPPPQPVTPSPSRRQPQPAQAAATTAAPRAAAGGAGTGPPQPQLTRVSSTRTPPSRGQPLSPVREPNSSAAPPAASATEEAKPPVKPDTPPQRAAHEAVPKELDIVVPREKIIREPPSDTTNTQSKSVGKENEKEDDKEKDNEKKDEDGKEKEKENEHKEKVNEKEHKKEKEHKEKEKEHKEKKDKDKHKEEHVDESKVHSGGKLHKELKAGVADMVHKLGATVAPPSSADRHAPGTGSTVITLAGENKGASMKISHAEQAESNKAATTTTKEPRARNKLVVDDGRRQEPRGAASWPGLTTAFVNSNVQVVNNSLVLQSSCSSNNPGVHLKLSAKSKKKKGVDGEDEEDGGKGGAAAAKKK